MIMCLSLLSRKAGKKSLKMWRGDFGVENLALSSDSGGIAREAGIKGQTPGGGLALAKTAPNHNTKLYTTPGHGAEP
jgi:hypothetical protein